VSDRFLPGIQPPADRKKIGIPLVMALVIACFAAIVLLVAVSSGGDDDDYDSDTSYEAIAQCEAAIEERLKAPTTAEFKSTAVGSGTWTVTGTVDSENSFGAMVRSSYRCSVIIDNEKDTARVRIDQFE
jgi:hypothetical protein